MPRLLGTNGIWFRFFPERKTETPMRIFKIDEQRKERAQRYSRIYFSFLHSHIPVIKLCDKMM